MQFKETRINQGGVLRCCLEGPGTTFKDDDEVEPGQFVECPYHEEGHNGSGMRLREDGVWEAAWIKDKKVVSEDSEKSTDLP